MRLLCVASFALAVSLGCLAARLHAASFARVVLFVSVARGVSLVSFVRAVSLVMVLCAALLVRVVLALQQSLHGQ